VVAALELYFDGEGTRRVRGLWDALESEGIQSLRSLLQQRHRPHLSLAVADRLDPAAVAEALRDIEVAAPVRLRFQYVGQFVGRVLWLGPVPSAALLEHHARVYERLDAAGVEVWEHYRPDRWVPHCTLSMRVPNPLMGTAVRRCLEYVPIDVSVVAAAVADHARGIAHPLPAPRPALG
jgi:hypothetical protein